MANLPTILTPRLRLRAWREGDLPRLAELAGAPEVYRFTLRIPRPYTIEHARQFMHVQREAWAKGEGLILAIARRDGDEVMGTVGLEINRAMDRAELGFWVGVEHWNRGYATEAAGAMLGYGFGNLGLNRIFAGHFAGNEASARVQQKLGMKREGVLRQAFKKDGTYHDDVIYAILRGEFEPGVEWTIQSE
ncbi:MAG: GNAT family N-acetyltransferase [Phycisphaerales bacterium]|nr:GNAT family N-acetyltransferase [Phycisphaerales bacterium]